MFDEMTRQRLHHLAIFAFVAASLLAYGRIVWLQRQYGSPLSGPPLAQTIGWSLLASFAFLAIVAWAEMRGCFSLRWIWVVAVLFRLFFLFARPALTDDVYRYIWDGQLARRGLSPYQFTVDAPDLDALDIPLRQLVNHRWMASPYPPATQFVFHALALAFPPEPFFFQLAMILFDLLAGLLLSRLLALASLPSHRLLIYLWNPLVIIEIAYNAHIDAWMILLSLAAVYLTLSPPHRKWQLSIGDAHLTTSLSKLLAPLFLALATLTKFLPALLLPVLFWRWSWRQRMLYLIASAGLLLPSGLLAGLGLGPESNGTGLFGALRIYLNQWNYNSGLFHWIEVALGAPGHGRPMALARLVIAGVMVIALLGLWLLGRNQGSIRQTTRLIFPPLALYILITPTVHPWYFLILVAFLPFLAPGGDETRRLWLWLLPWFYLSVLLPLSYATYIDPSNPGELEWIRQLEWVPALLLLSFAVAVSSLARFRTSRHKGESAHAATHA